MSGFQWKAINSIGAIVGVVLMLQDLAIAQSQTTTTQIDKPNRVSVSHMLQPKISFFRSSTVA
jgi:hypothetical protein